MNRRELLKATLLAPFLWMLPKAEPPQAVVGIDWGIGPSQTVVVLEAYDPESEKSYRKIGDGEWEEYLRCPDEPRPLLNRIYYPSPQPTLGR